MHTFCEWGKTGWNSASQATPMIALNQPISRHRSRMERSVGVSGFAIFFFLLSPGGSRRASATLESRDMPSSITVKTHALTAKMMSMATLVEVRR